MEINWTLITFLAIGFFAINGFFRGWWKEVFTTAVIVFFMFLLQQPSLAQTTIDLVNKGIAVSWNLTARVAGSFFTMADTAPQLNPNSSMDWVLMLLIFLGVAGILARILLPGSTGKVPGQYYTIGLLARVLGFGLGATNGFLVLGLVREYLDGRALPGQASSAAAAQAASSITVLSSSSSFAEPASSISINLTSLPSITVLDNIMPYAVVGIGGLLVLAALLSRLTVAHSPEHGYKFNPKIPYGYQKIDVKKASKEPPREVIVLNK